MVAWDKKFCNHLQQSQKVSVCDILRHIYTGIYTSDIPVMSISYMLRLCEHQYAAFWSFVVIVRLPGLVP